MMKNKFLLAAFLEGFLLLAVELSCAQLLHPFYGQSYYVWLTVLSVTMLGSAIGYFVGGFIAKNEEKIKLYVTLNLLILSLFLTLTYLINDKLFSSLYETDFIKALIIQSFVILCIPVVLITSFSPIIVRYYALEQNHAGKSSGRVFFASTFGGIFSVYLTAFYLFPNFQLVNILYLCAFIVLLSALIFHLLSNKFIHLVVQLFLFFILFAAVKPIQKERLSGKNTKIVHREHGLMGELEIRDEFAEDRRFISSNRTTQSAIKKSSGQSLWSYPYKVSIYSSLFPAQSKVLVAGLGGGVLVNQLIELNFDIDVVEFDKRVYEVSKKYMGMKENFNFIVDDFRHHINTTGKKYDLIIIDLSKGESMPSNVYTVEAFKQLRNILNKNGVVLIHYFSNVYGTGNLGLHSIIKTAKRAGYFCGVAHKFDSSPEEIIVFSDHTEIIPYKVYRVSSEKLQTFNISPNQVFDFKREFNEGEILYDDINNLERVQFNVVSEIRDKLRVNEKNAFF